MSAVRDWLRAAAARPLPTRALAWRSAFDVENGAGVRIALIDGGFYATPATFADAAIQVRDVSGRTDWADRARHGTDNAALLVGQGGPGERGICPGAELLVALALGHPDRRRASLAVASAIAWAADAEAAIIALPIGTPNRAPEIVRAVRAARARGCRVLAAAGNRGPDELAFPAALPTVEAVSALSRDGGAFAQCYAGPGVDHFAHGERVPAVGTEGTLDLSGSSIATVIAAGLLALDLAARRRAAACGAARAATPDAADAPLHA